jgi:peptidyl-prolyl cis-trans isomerase C
VIKELQDGGDFAEVAKTRSKGPSGPNGGDLGFFGEGQMVPAFSKIAFAMKAGETTDEPVQTQFGWHVIKVEARRKVEPETLENSQEQLRIALSRQIGSAFLKGLRETATVERFNLDGTPMKNEDAGSK